MDRKKIGYKIEMIEVESGIYFSARMKDHIYKVLCSMADHEQESIVESSYFKLFVLFIALFGSNYEPNAK